VGVCAGRHEGNQFNLLTPHLGYHIGHNVGGGNDAHFFILGQIQRSQMRQFLVHFVCMIIMVMVIMTFIIMVIIMVFGLRGSISVGQSRRRCGLAARTQCQQRHKQQGHEPQPPLIEQSHHRCMILFFVYSVRHPLRAMAGLTDDNRIGNKSAIN
jgi:hypothetical protein